MSLTLPLPMQWGDGVSSTIMLHHKLIAGEIPGTYLVTELINKEDLLTIANQIARQILAKGIAITDKYLLQ
ncbi:hypothetical protein OB956_04040 [Aeromonas dhakensis]|nr:hypothetical protein [Aeromonas dhakensis]MDM5053455.1 hypothetical protein [Aeromonas dhakensis]MDM5079804.1 hypothetical protein [Aeromonas dhakensis]